MAHPAWKAERGDGRKGKWQKIRECKPRKNPLKIKCGREKQRDRKLINCYRRILRLAGDKKKRLAGVTGGWCEKLMCSEVENSISFSFSGWGRERRQGKGKGDLTTMNSLLKVREKAPKSKS